MVTPEELLSAALQYASWGYAVLPCAPLAKIPLTPHGVKDATTNPDVIQYWWNKWPQANVAIACRGLAIIDVDAGNRYWPGAEDPQQELSATVTTLTLTARGGKHYWFRRPEGKRWKGWVGELAPHVDLRTDGNYILLPPSEIAEGAEILAYRWCEGLELSQPLEQLPCPPNWLIEKLDNLSSAEQTSSQAAALTLTQENEPIHEGKRNDTLFRLACAVRRYGMDRGELLALLREVNRRRCQPPLPLAEVERIAQSAAQYAPSQVQQCLLWGHNPLEESSDSSELDLKEVPVDKPEIPREWLRVPGFIGEVSEYILQTAPYPEPVLAFANALILQATLAARKMQTTTGLRSNLYILALADSATGKEHPRKVVSDLLCAFGLEDHLAHNIGSAEGVEDRLRTQSTLLLQIDEISELVERLQSGDQRGSNLQQMFLQLYSAANSSYRTRLKANSSGDPAILLHQPALLICGTAVPSYFYRAFNERMLTNGFMGRMLILEAGWRGFGQRPPQLPIPASILDTGRWWAEYHQRQGNLHAQHPRPQVVPETPQAQQRLDEIQHTLDALIRQHQQHDRQLDAGLWGRLHEKIVKLAFLYAISADHENPQITLEAVEWSERLCFFLLEQMLQRIRLYSTKDPFDAKRRALIRLLQRWQERYGDRPMPYSLILRQLPWPPKEHEILAQLLCEQGFLAVEATAGKRGRPGKKYRILQRLEL